MSKNRDLLKEAIADAKAVRETALQNAKMALEEAFTPRLKSMLSKKIQSEEGYDMEEDDEMEDEEEMERQRELERDQKQMDLFNDPDWNWSGLR